MKYLFPCCPDSVLFHVEGYESLQHVLGNSDIINQGSLCRNIVAEHKVGPLEIQYRCFSESMRK